MEDAAMKTKIMNGMSLNKMKELKDETMKQSANAFAEGMFGEGTTFNATLG